MCKILYSTMYIFFVLLAGSLLFSIIYIFPEISKEFYYVFIKKIINTFHEILNKIKAIIKEIFK